MDWKNLFRILVFGRMPVTLQDARSDIRSYRVIRWVWVLLAVFVYLAVMQQSAEVDSCWAELEGYRLADSVVVVGDYELVGLYQELLPNGSFGDEIYTLDEIKGLLD